MARITDIKINVKVNLNLWSAIKLRIAGLGKYIDKIETVGRYSIIKFK